MARDGQVQAQNTKESEHRGVDGRLGPKREATAGLRELETEEAGTGSGSASAYLRQLL